MVAHRWVGWLAVTVALVVALTLAGCGASVAPSPRGSDATQTTTATRGAAPTTGLPTPGSSAPATTDVTITTDNHAYQPEDEINATITNHLSKPVFASGGKVNCTIVEAQVKTAQGWQKAPIAPCGDSDTSDVVQIAPGATRAVTLDPAGAFFLPGTYRLALNFSTYSVPPPLSAPLRGSPGQGGSLVHATSSPLETNYSQPFTIG
jgi:hypothetical protein